MPIFRSVWKGEMPRMSAPKVVASISIGLLYVSNLLKFPISGVHYSVNAAPVPPPFNSHQSILSSLSLSLSPGSCAALSRALRFQSYQPPLSSVRAPGRAGGPPTTAGAPSVRRVNGRNYFAVVAHLTFFRQSQRRHR